MHFDHNDCDLVTGLFLLRGRSRRTTSSLSGRSDSWLRMTRHGSRSSTRCRSGTGCRSGTSSRSSTGCRSRKRGIRRRRSRSSCLGNRGRYGSRRRKRRRRRRRRRRSRSRTKGSYNPGGRGGRETSRRRYTSATADHGGSGGGDVGGSGAGFVGAGFIGAGNGGVGGCGGGVRRRRRRR